MTEAPSITTRPDRPGEVFIHLPDFTHFDSQVWAADLGLPVAALRPLRDTIATHLDTAELVRQRKQLIETMSGASEARWSASWLMGLERILHAEGGIWETVGRATGWPMGDYEKWTWLSWDEAAALYAAELAKKAADLRNAFSHNPTREA